MTIKRKASGAMTDIAAAKRRSSGAWVNVTIKRRSGGVWVTVFPVLTITPATASVSFTNSPPSSAPSTRSLTTNSVTASGGSSYSWAFLSGDNTITATSPSTASTQFSATVPVDGTKSAVFRVTSSGATADVNVSLTYNSGL